MAKGLGSEPEDIERGMARLERSIAQLRAKLERQKAAAEDSRFQLDLFEDQLAKLKGAK